MSPLTPEQSDLAASCYLLAWKLAAQVGRQAGGDLDELLSTAMYRLLDFARRYDGRDGIPFAAFVARCMPQQLWQVVKRRTHTGKGTPRPAVYCFSDCRRTFGLEPDRITPPEPDALEAAEDAACAARRLARVRRSAGEDDYSLLVRYYRREVASLASEMGVSRQRVQQRVKSALARLREELA